MAAIIDRDKGYRRLVATLGDIDAPAVLVGVRGKATPYGDGTTVVSIATINEFGSADGRVPERSFLRSTVRENREQYARALSDGLGRVVDGRERLADVLGRLGLRVQRDVQAKIVDLRDPPNAPSTIARKGSSNPLIDTGRLRQSIDYEVVE